jgi:hypothetical protein
MPHTLRITMRTELVGNDWRRVRIFDELIKALKGKFRVSELHPYSFDCVWIDSHVGASVASPSGMLRAATFATQMK